MAVVNAYTEETLFSNGNAIGQTISLNGKKYEIIGVLKEEESSSLGFNSEQMELISLILPLCDFLTA